MAGTYGVTISIKVKKGQDGSVIESEDFFFEGVAFAMMSFISSEFFELIKKLQKK